MNVYELPSHKFGRRMGLFEQAGFDQMFMRPALMGRHETHLVVDNSETPTNAILFCRYEFYVAGDANAPALRQFIRESPAEINAFQTFHGFAPIGDAWKAALEQDFGRDLIVLPRWNYRWVGRSVVDWRSRMPDRASLVPVTATLAQRLDREWHEHIGFLWDGYDQYAKYGYGFCLTVADELASFALTDGVDDRAMSIGVATAPQFRRRGFGQIVCSALIEETLRRGLLPVWGTEDRNVPSKALAASLGFVQDKLSYQLSRPDYGPLTLSTGKWEVIQGVEGIRVWQRT